MRKQINKVLLIFLAIMMSLASTFAQCPITVHAGNGTSGNSRAPIGTFRYERVVYLIPQSELVAAGIPSGQNIGTIGWVYSTAANLSSTGNLNIYFQNTSDVTNTKSTNWATATSTMSLAHSATYTLPGTPTTTFDITLSGAPFNYTGGGLYVAFEWNNPSNPLSSGTVVSCNIALTGGLLGQQNNVSLPTTMVASNFRPVTRLGVAFNNDAKVETIYTLGSMPNVFTANHVMQALVTNSGANTLTGLNVTLNITGANTFTDVQTIASLAPCASTMVSFAAFTPTSTGTNNISVSVPADDNNGNNTKAMTQPVTTNLYSYKYAAPISGGVGFNGGIFGVFVSKFNTAVPAQINEVKVDFQLAGASRQFRIAIYDESGGLPNNLLYTSPSVINISSAAQQAFISISPTVAVTGNYFVGVIQETSNTVNIGFSYQSEAPPRANTFYYANALTGGPWVDFSPAAPFRSAIEVQLYVPQPPNCPIMNSPADLSTACITGTTLNWASGGGAPTGYRLTFGNNAPSYDNIMNDVDMGNLLSYATGALSSGTYGWKVTAYNLDGTSAGCVVKTFTTNLATCYCQPTYAVGTGSGDYVSLVEIPTTTLTNPSAGAAVAPFYTLYPQSGSTTASLAIGSSYTMNVAGGTWSSCYIRAWIDFNQNGDFETTESVGVSGNVGALTTGSFNFTVPGTAVNGTTRMRVRSSDTAPGPGDLESCGATNSDYGETEDYDITIFTPVACSGTPAPGNTLSTNNPVCPSANFTLSLQNNPVESGLTYQWQSSPDGITWTNIALATNSTLTTSQTVTTWYQCVVTCTNSSQSSNSTPLQITMNPFNLCYCAPGHFGCGNGDITNVTVNTLNNTSTCSGTAYASFPQSGNTTTALKINQTYSFSVTSDQSCIISVWIDFNQDGVFDASEWTQVATTSTANVASVVSINIPPTALTGSTGMRVRSRLAGFANGSGDACIYMGSGEGEDYVITIDPPVCLASPTFPVDASNACSDQNGDLVLSWPALLGATGYDVYFGTNPLPSTLVAANHQTTTFTVNVAQSTVYYWMIVPQILGGGSQCNVWSFTTSPIPTPVANSGGDVCLGFDIALSSDNIALGQSSGNTFAWTGPNGYSSNDQNPNIIAPGVLYSGTYTVVVTNQYGCTASASTSLNINANPTLTIDSVQNVGCVGGTDGIIYVSASGGLAPYSYTSDFINFNTNGIMNNLPTGSTVIYAADGNACQAQITGNLTAISSAPPTQSVVIPISGLPNYACNATAATLSIPAVANATFYTWDGPPGTTFNGNPSPYSTSTPTVSVVFGNPNGSGYRIGVQAGNGCGSTLRKSQWLRGIVSTPAAVSGATTTCASTSGSYSTGAVDGATSYLWTITGDASVSGTGTSVTVNFGPAWAGGTLCVSSQTPCFTSPAKCLVIGTSASPLNAINGPLSACPNDVLTFSVPASSGAASYAWTVPANSSISGGAGTNSIQVTFAPNYNNIGNICVNVTSICGVTSASKCRTVVPGVPSVPASITGATNGLCGQSISYSTPFSAGTTYNWTAPGSITGNGTNAVSIAYGSFTTGQVCVTASTGCGASAARCISIKGAPNSPIAITTTPASWCANTSGVEFNANVSNTAGSYTLSWTYPSAPVATYTSGGGNTQQLVLDWGTGNGTVTITATNSCGAGSKAYVATIGCREGQLATANNLNVYPNPTAGVLNVEYTAEKGTAQVTVLDLSGRVVMTQTHANAAGQNTLQLDLSKVAKGAYMLNVQTNGSNNQVRVVVE